LQLPWFLYHTMVSTCKRHSSQERYSRPVGTPQPTNPAQFQQLTDDVH
jgi:hypothetical protein